MESDKNEKCSSDCACNDYEDAKYVPDNCVANKKPSGGKVVRVNEAAVCEDDENIVGFDTDETFDSEDGNILTDDELAEYVDNNDYENEKNNSLFEQYKELLTDKQRENSKTA